MAARRKSAPKPPKGVMKRCVFYVDESTYRKLRATMLERGTNVTAWIRNCIAAEMAKA